MRDFINSHNNFNIILMYYVVAKYKIIMYIKRSKARVAKLVDALDLGSNAIRRGGSTPPSRNFIFILFNL